MRLVVASLTILASATIALSALPQAKPIVTVKQNAYQPGRFQTLREVATAADAIVEGTILGRRNVEGRAASTPGSGPARLPPVMSSFDVQLTRVYKSSQKADVRDGMTIDVRRPGGQRERDTFIEDIVDENFPMFQVKERYILFLVGGQPTYSHFGVVSADGVFKVSDTSVQPIGAGAIAAAHRDQSVVSFRALLGGLGGDR